MTEVILTWSGPWWLPYALCLVALYVPKLVRTILRP